MKKIIICTILLFYAPVSFPQSSIYKYDNYGNKIYYQVDTYTPQGIATKKLVVAR